jgi:hypothetical protein
MNDVFILCHDQELVLNDISKNAIKITDPYKIIFMGDRPTDKIKSKENLIISKNLQYNIEQHKNCLQYCGWYAIFKNNLSKTDYIRLIDYDIIIDKWDNKTDKDVKSLIFFNNDFYFYEGFGDHITFQNNIKKFLNYDLKTLAENYYKKTNNNKWFSSCDVLIKRRVFIEFMEWMDEVFKNQKNNYYFGMHFERYLSIFCMAKNLEYECISNESRHLQQQSHPYY